MRPQPVSRVPSRKIALRTMRSWTGAPTGISRQSGVWVVGRFKPNAETGSSRDAGSVAVARLVGLKQGRRPKLLCLVEHVDPQVGPPRHLIAMAMQLMM